MVENLARKFEKKLAEKALMVSGNKAPTHHFDV